VFRGRLVHGHVVFAQLVEEWADGDEFVEVTDTGRGLAGEQVPYSQRRYDAGGTGRTDAGDRARHRRAVRVGGAGLYDEAAGAEVQARGQRRDQEIGRASCRERE